MVLTTLVSCGKDNKVAVPAAAANPATTAITVTDQAGITLGTAIDNHVSQFGLGTVLYAGQYRETWSRILQVGIPLNYLYTQSNSATSANGQTCEKKWGIFYVCSYSSYESTTASGTVTTSRTVTGAAVDINAKINELKSLINTKNPLIPIQVSQNYQGGASYLITALDGKQYVIDTRYPLQANPIGVRTPAVGTTAAKTEYLYNIVQAQ